VLYYY